MTLKLHSALRHIAGNRFVRFILVGVVNSIFGYACFGLFLYFGLHYSMALLSATVLGVIFNFKTTGSLVFGSQDNRLILRFILGYVFIYTVQLAALHVLTEQVGLAAYLGGALLIPPMAVLAFIVNRSFVFRNVQTD